ncbi:hypothetical protein FH972_024635 [Carpinus fangiana]|uniref:Non-specific serine/threonine protein kinase n=1 Tax=Carpinus fangiana TaxID=176857 RepID=A0A5N6KZ31_9ROSI|nr:hypothetical protein FH972_024635 [Carpinus fangiana]
MATQALSNRETMERELDSWVSRLDAGSDNAQVDLKPKVAAITELRDNIERWCQSSLYVHFLKRMIPVWMKILDGQPSFMNLSSEQKLRNYTLEIIHRLPMAPAEALEQYAGQLVDKMMELIKVENEDNAILCIKITMDLLRHQTKVLAGHVQPFLDLIQKLFEGLDQVVQDTFNPSAQVSGPAAPHLSNSPRPGSPAVPPPDVGQEQQQQNRPLQKGVNSFKTFAELPIVVVSVFQAYRDVVQENVKRFIPLIKKVLLLQAPAQEQAHADAKAKGTIQIGLTKDIKNRAAFAELVTAQVKTTSFLAYVLRVFGQQLSDFLPIFPDIVIRLLRDCPKEKCNVRKELLVAVRHIINFNFRLIFLDRLDELLDERTLLGDGLTVQETLRPIAYSLLADLIHHVRGQLKVQHIRATVRVYTRNLREPVPGTSYQTMSAKLLLNMAECIAKIEDKQEARYHLMAILDAVADKLAAMNRHYKNAIKLSKNFDPRSTESPPEEYVAHQESPPEWDEVDIFTAGPIKMTTPRERAADPVTDNKFLFKNLIGGLKSIFYQLRMCNPSSLVDPANVPPNWSEVASGFSAEEVKVLIKLFHEGVQVFRYYSDDPKEGDDDKQGANFEVFGSAHMGCNKDEKDLLESFATVFHHVDPATFHEIFHSEIPHLFEMSSEHPALVHIPQFLLASEATSPSFSGMLLHFLMERMEDVGTADVHRASILLRLFKLSFMAVTLFSATNEQVLLPHVNKIVTQSLKLSTTAEAPMHYFYLLRSLFRSIGGGRFEHLYKEILPLLEMLLEVLNNLISAARKTHERDLYVELSLTVPARLSNLLPHLSYLMKPLVIALRAGSELVGQGLRTLELCVDNLTADYLDPIMAPVIDDLMTALWDHLRPSPYNHFHAHTTMRILGKLGGRNRKFLEGPPELTFEKFSDKGCKIDVQLIGASRESELSATLGAQLAISKIQEAPKMTQKPGDNDVFYKKQALDLVISQLKLFLGTDVLPDNFAQLVRLQADDLRDGNYGEAIVSTTADRDRSVAKRDEQQKVFKDLIKACIFAVSVPELELDAKNFLEGLCRHFTLLDVGHALNDKRQDRSRFVVDAGEGLLVLDHNVLVHAMVESLSSEQTEVREAVEHAMTVVYQSAVAIMGPDKSNITKLPFFSNLMAAACHACYHEEWFTKAGGALGIEILAIKLDLDTAWVSERQTEICRALMYTAKDLPEDLPHTTRVQALDTLYAVISLCNKNVTHDEALASIAKGREDAPDKFQALVSFFLLELCHNNQHVRAAAQKGLAMLAEITDTEVHELLAPIKMRLLAHIFNKPVRALPLPVQIAYVEAIAYCLKLQHGILEQNEGTARFLREALQLADQEDEAFAARNIDQRNFEYITKLRVSTLRLLSQALDFPDFTNSPSNKGRPKIIAVFFKQLYAKSPEVVEAANEALKTVVERDPKLPKDVLQAGLRPVLVSLQEPQRLKTDVLECLARLLQLLKNYFKVEIGTRLLDNAKLIADAQVLQRASFMLVEQNDRIKLVAAIMNIFHLLPPAASVFMDKIISKTLELEETLRRTHFSPFRDPVNKYLNKYPQETWDHFTNELLSDRIQGRFLAQILGDKRSGPLREVGVKSVDRLIELASGDMNNRARRIAFINTLHIADAICGFADSRKVLLANEEFRKTIISQGKVLEQQLKANEVDTDLRLAAEQAGNQLLSVVLSYLAEHPKDLETLFELIEATTSQQLRETPEIYRHIYGYVICQGDVEHWRHVIVRSVGVYTSRTASEEMKAFCLRNFVTPILAMDVMNNWQDLFGEAKKGTKLVNISLAQLFRDKLWDTQSKINPVEDNVPAGIDFVRIELLQMTTMLLKYHSQLIQDVRKEVIRFGWNYIRLEDVINKHAAYVVLAYFIAFFETPPKIAGQVYGSLIAAHAPEARSLVVQALEVLAPVIPKRIGEGEGKMSVWARAARRPILDDPSNLQQMMSIFQFVARHPDLFYDAKEVLSSTIIASIHKVAQMPNPSLDSKKMAVSFVNLIWKWEEQYCAEVLSTRSPKRSADGTELTPAPRATTFMHSTSYRMMLVKYLVTFTASLPDRYPLPAAKQRESAHTLAPQHIQATDVIKKAVTLLYSFLSPGHWSDLDIDHMFPKVTEGILTQEPKPDDKLDLSYTRFINTLQILGIFVNVKSDEWILGRLPQLQKLLEKAVRNPHPEVQESLYVKDDNTGTDHRPIVLRIVSAIPQKTDEEDLPDADAPGAEFITFLSTVASEALTAGNHSAGINILSVFAKCKPEEIDQHIGLIMKALTQVVKDHLAPTNPLGQSPSRIVETSKNETPAQKAQADLILKIIDVLAMRVSQLGDNRRPYLSALTTLVEKSPSADICSKILDLVSEWIFKPTQVFPTLKEKNAVIVKMMAFEKRSDQTLFNKFLDVIISIYEDPKITRSELAIRLESAFLVGTRAPDIEMRNRFMALFDRHLSRTASRRLLYVLASQNWESLADSFWLSQATQLLFGSIEMNMTTSLSAEDFTAKAVSTVFESSAEDPRLKNLMLDDDFEEFMESHRAFCSDLGKVRTKDILEPLCYLQHIDDKLAYSVWVELFPSFWAILAKEERAELHTGMISLLTKEYHMKQLDDRPNCVQALLDGIARLQHPRMNFPHHLMKYLARTYNAWYTALYFMEESAVRPIVNTSVIRESNQDALAEVYASLQEDDLFYGLWRRRSQFLDTNTAMSYEQHGDWERAQRSIEAATFKARTGAAPFSQSEYMLWEDHWVMCAQKLQQWDILADFAKMDSLNDLYLDATWRQFDAWHNQDPRGVEQRKQLESVIKSISDAPTPRRAFFQAFMALLRFHQDPETQAQFQRTCDEAVQLSIRKWHQLPRRITNAHVPILQNFQQLVELNDASVICASLASTTAQNLDQKAPELKLLLGTWRDRLPNFWDDINAWQDLVTWRRHVFMLVNTKYLSLIPQGQTNAQGNSFAFRGYHETAWTINQFAHVARKHQMPEVCINQLSTIYTLPNIEIQEAFLKLREQAKCHYSNDNELQTGLDVINNTNLNYFGQQQKAEFFTLKGMFLAKQKQMDDANEAFGSALYYDIKLPKAWAEWARYNEQLYKDDPNDITKAGSAISCYLEAAGTYKNSKSRKMLSRVLYLLSLDDAEGTLCNTFEEYKGDTPVWYWITFIPQLLNSVSRPEARIVRQILTKIAKAYPQALYYNLRTVREDQQAIKKNFEAKERAARAKNQGSPSAAKQGSPDSKQAAADGQGESSSRPATSGGESAPNGASASPKAEDNKDSAAVKTEAGQNGQNGATKTPQPKKPWDQIEEIVSVLKTAFPLLALSMETMVDRIAHSFKCPPDEDAYRLIVALINDAFSYISRSPQAYAPGAKLPQNTEANVARFAETVLPPHIRKSFEEDFVHKKPDLLQYITMLRKWRDRFEEKLDRRPSTVSLETFGPVLSEFKFQKFDDVEIPGQYLLHKDSNKDFIRIERFLPDVDLTRGIGVCHRRLRIRGHDGSIHPFIIQTPAPRTARQEERMHQLFRFFNDILAKRKESRRRKLQFTIPLQVMLAPSLRMVQDDPSSITLQGIFEDWCRRTKLNKDEPLLFTANRLREQKPRTPEETQQVRLQVYDALQTKLVPKNIVLDYFQRTYPSFDDFWLFRRQSAYQLATLSFMTFVMVMRDRNPSRMSFSRATGNMWGTDLVLNMAGGPKGPQLHSGEAVPFRLTPNLQILLGPIAMEGIFSSAMLVIAKCLTEPEFKLEQQLSLFIRDEVNLFYTRNQRGNYVSPGTLRDVVSANCQMVVKRAIALAVPPPGNLPANQTVLDQVSRAVNPTKLAQMDPLWMPYL